MHLYGITAHVSDFTIDGQSIYTTIEAMSARERSGFVLDHFSGRFYLTNGALGFEDTSVVTPRSNVDIPYISLVGDSWAGYKDFLGEVRIDGKLRNSTVSTDDIAYFAPRLRGWHTVFSNIDIDVAGVVSDFTGKVRSLQVGQGTWFTADAAVRGLPDIRATHFDLTIPRLTSTAESIDALAAGIGGRALSDKLVAILGNSGDIDVSARFRGLLSSFDMRVGAKTDVGGIDCNLQMSPLRDGRSSVKGDVAARNLRLGELLGRRDLLGNATLTAFVDGVVGRGFTDANVVGNVTQLGFNGYVYDSLRLDGRLRNREFDGRITARDPNLDFDFFGTVDLNDSVPRYDFTMDLRHADLARLHVNRRDSVSELSAHIVAKAGGRSLDDLNGRIRVTDVLYRYNDKQLTSKSMTVTGENSARSKLVELRSDFADATFRSKTSYREVFRYLRASAWKYLPPVAARRRGVGAPRIGGWPSPTTIRSSRSTSAISTRSQMPSHPACRSPMARRCNCFSTPRATSFRSRRLRNISNANVCWPRGSTSTLRTGAIRSRSMLRPKTLCGYAPPAGGFRSRAVRRGACSFRQGSTIRCARYPDWWASGLT